MKQKNKLAISIAFAMAPAIAFAGPRVSGVDDTATTTASQGVVVNVLANDSGHRLSLTGVDSSSVNGGTITINSDGSSVTYTPGADYTGSDEFTYTLQNRSGRTASATVFVTVEADNTDTDGTDGSTDPDTGSGGGYTGWPVAIDDPTTTTVDAPVAIPVLENDLGQNLTIVDSNAITYYGGTTTINGSVINYTPPPGRVGMDSFWYSISDTEGRTNSIQVNVTITEPGYTGVPIALDDPTTTTLNTSVVIPVLENDLGNGLTIKESNAVSYYGGKTVIEGSNIRYTPPADHVGADSFWYSISDAEGRTNSVQVNVTVTDNDAGGLLGFDLITMQTDVMYDTNFQYSATGQPETGGFVYFEIADAAAGATQLEILGGGPSSSASALMPKQVVTYIGVDGEFYTSTVASINGNIVNLNQPLQVDVRTGYNLQNFYADGVHAHVGGLSAVVDYALREMNDPSLNAGKHVLLGDSWFSEDYVKNRLAERLPNAEVVSHGVGGLKSSDLLASFDQNVVPQNPDVVWVMAGTNDYFAEVSAAEYVANMRGIIEKIRAMGARAIVLEPSLAPLMFGTDDLYQLSKAYAAGLADIQAQ